MSEKNESFFFRNIKTAENYMNLSSGAKDLAGRLLKYDYLGAVLKVLFAHFRGSEEKRMEDAIEQINEKKKAVCWDYARAEKLIIANTSKLKTWTAGYTCSAKFAPHTFLIVDGYAILKENEWIPIGTDPIEIKTALEIASSGATKVSSTLLVQDPFYDPHTFLPGDQKLEKKRGAHAKNPWYVMDPKFNYTKLITSPKNTLEAAALTDDYVMLADETKPKCCKFENFAETFSVGPGKNTLWRCKKKINFTEQNWAFYS